MSVQLELSFDSKVTLMPDGSYKVEPGKLVAKKSEDWRWMADVMRDDPGALPYKDRQDNVMLINCGDIRGRKRSKLGWWEIEMNSVRAHMKSLEQKYA